ncbi:MAG: energy transducer TonB [Acidobacteria bacterium]|nr:energy transducer TonB [Acidobacteriota bacterium]
MRSSEPLTLGLLPEKRRDWRTFLLGYTLCMAGLLLLFLAHLVWPDRMDSWARFTVTDIIHRPDLVQEKPEITPQKISKPIPEVRIEAPKLVVPKEIVRPKLVQAKIEPPRLQTVNLAAPKLQPVPAAMPARIVHTGEFASSAPPAVNAPVQKVQTGGFGDPNGLPGEGKQGAKLAATQLGSFDMPAGAQTGNGSGGNKGIRGTIASAGFGSGIAQPGLDARRNGQVVKTSGFGSQQIATASAHTVDDARPRSTEVEILYKPKPVYTEEARRLKIEGEVLLEVVFEATGELRVNRVVRGLGHGLDEAAVNAANKIKFKPAERNGSAVDSTAIVHVMFQVAS